MLKDANANDELGVNSSDITPTPAEVIFVGYPCPVLALARGLPFVSDTYIGVPFQLVRLPPDEKLIPA
jgi:hypothetical protein